MGITIISGTAYADISIIEKMFDKYNSKENLLLMWPEVSDRPVHPKLLDKKIQETTEKCIDEDKNLIICTFNDIVFNAVRVAIHKKHSSGVLHSVDDAGHVSSSNIDSSGRLDRWFDGVFDTWDNQLDTLIGLD